MNSEAYWNRIHNLMSDTLGEIKKATAQGRWEAVPGCSDSDCIHFVMYWESGEVFRSGGTVCGINRGDE